MRMIKLLRNMIFNSTHRLVTGITLAVTTTMTGRRMDHCHGGGRPESSIRIAMRQAERRRLFSLKRPLVLCFLSAIVMIVVLYLQTVRSFTSANAAAAWQHNNSNNQQQQHTTTTASEPWQREKGLVLSSAAAHHQNAASSSSSAAVQGASSSSSSSQASSSTSSSSTSLAAQQFAIPPLHQFAPRRDDEDSQDDEQDERYHNPSLYGWTPDVYPDPLLNPIRCAIAYLPESNMTDGLR